MFGDEEENPHDQLLHHQHSSSSGGNSGAGGNGNRRSARRGSSTSASINSASSGAGSRQSDRRKSGPSPRMQSTGNVESTTISSTPHEMAIADDFTQRRDGLTAEQAAPVFREVQSMRLRRLSRFMTCMCALLFVVFLLVVVLILLGITALIDQRLPLYVNVYRTSYTVDQGWNVAAQTVVSSIEGMVRPGLGFLPTRFQSIVDFERAGSPNPGFRATQLSPSSTVFAYTTTDETGLNVVLTTNSSKFASSHGLNDFKDNLAIHDIVVLNESMFVVLFSVPNRQLVYLAAGKADDQAISIQLDSNPATILNKYIVDRSNPLRIVHLLPRIDPDGMHRRVAVLHSLSNECSASVWRTNGIDTDTGSTIWISEYSHSIDSHPCQSAGISILDGDSAVIATQETVSILNLTYPAPISLLTNPAPFSCIPESNSLGSPFFSTSIDVRATSNQDFLLICTRSSFNNATERVVAAAAHFDATQSKVQIGPFGKPLIFNALPGSVTLSSYLEHFSDGSTAPRTISHAVFISYIRSDYFAFTTIRVVTSTRSGTPTVLEGKLFTHEPGMWEVSAAENASKRPPIVTAVSRGSNSTHALAFIRAISFNNRPAFLLEDAQWFGGIKWVGVAVSSGRSMESVTVVQRDLRSGFSGLIPGAYYYADVTGTLTLSTTDTFVGIARSENELMLSNRLVEDAAA